ncbi:MAG: exonuclease SbcCD subunit D C-terminal domain-containing protein [Candidatus Wallbacteria bacterium]|nr:exonuclease SbcCD subunit D C-terminal domain-containing protein [Candidatus Wallbacteria bacterium]
MLRLLHTSDWHLGHSLHGHARDYEHERFLDWLLETLQSERIDSLLVAGDLFDTANPTAAAQAQWFRFVAAARTRMPGLELIFLGGNHDSAARLDAPRPIFDALGVHVVGGLPRCGDGSLDHERLLVPLRSFEGAIEAWLVALPFLRPVDLPRVDSPEADPLVEGVRQLYVESLAAARERLQPQQALVAAGHCYLTGTALSELSERKILGGNQHALPADIFPEDLAYVALGHLHLAQIVAGRKNVRYSGSPLPLSLAESGYRHQVLIVEFEQGGFREARSLAVPRFVELLRVPCEGSLPPPDLLAELARLPAKDDSVPDRQRPYLEAVARLEGPEPALRQQVAQTLSDRSPRLLKLTVERTGHGLALPEASQATSLADLTPEEVFRSCHERSFSQPPPAELLATFHELLDRLGRGEGR